MLRMVDRDRRATSPTAGRTGSGSSSGAIAVDPAFWFFQAHFYQDPVWPGSLGLESFLQLLKYAAWKRWGDPPRRRLADGRRSNRPHSLGLPRPGASRPTRR